MSTEPAEHNPENKRVNVVTYIRTPCMLAKLYFLQSKQIISFFHPKPWTGVEILSPLLLSSWKASIFVGGCQQDK